MEAAGSAYIENAGNAHRQLQIISDWEPYPIAGITDALLETIEGDDLNDLVMGNTDQIWDDARTASQIVKIVHNIDQSGILGPGIEPGDWGVPSGDASCPTIHICFLAGTPVLVPGDNDVEAIMAAGFEAEEPVMLAWLQLHRTEVFASLAIATAAISIGIHELEKRRATLDPEERKRLLDKWFAENPDHFRFVW